MRSVSVIIPAHNSEAFLRDAIESALNQSCGVDEVIVVDDGSTDRTAEIAESFGGPVNLLRQKNAGPSAARNAALERASGEFIAFLDADDLWMPQKLERQIAYLTAYPEVGTVASSFLRFGAIAKPQDVYVADAALRRFQPIDFLSSTRVHQSTLMSRVGVARAVRYPEEIADAEDAIYTALLRTQAPIGAVEDVLMRRREHGGQATKTCNFFRRGVEARITWAKAHYESLGLASADVAVAAVFRDAVHDVLAPYWNREVALFRSRRDQLLTIWPDDEPVPKDLRRALPPVFLLHLKDLLDGLVLQTRSHASTALARHL